jgi:hypothetical protein
MKVDDYDHMRTIYSVLPHHIHVTLYYNRQVSMAFTYGSSDWRGSWPLTSTQSHSLKLNDISSSPALAKQSSFSHSFPQKILPHLSWIWPSGFHFSGFRNNIIFLPSRVVSLESNPQPGGPGSCVYTPQWQGGSVISPGTGFPFRRFLRLAGLRWGYSKPPPHGVYLSYSIK